MSRRLLLLKKLDGYPIIREEEGGDEDDAVGGGDSDDWEGDEGVGEEGGE